MGVFFDAVCFGHLKRHNIVVQVSDVSCFLFVNRMIETLTQWLILCSPFIQIVSRHSKTLSVSICDRLAYGLAHHIGA